MKIPKKYQETAINKIFKLVEKLIKAKDFPKIVLEAPTGSGKTFMMSKCIEKITKEITNDVCFLWISIGKGNLHEQSYYSLKDESNDILKCSLAEQEFFGGRNIIEENEVVFVNWDKLHEKDSDNNWLNVLMRDKEQNSFPNVLNQTRNANRKIILIIDESHYGATSERSLELIYDVIKPNLIIEMSATPIINNPDGYYKVNPRDVKKEQMIKNDIIINKDLESLYKIDNEINSTILALDAAYNKREELKKLYTKNNSSVNPLVLIQIPNKDAGDDKKKIIEEFLYNKNITYENGKLYAWLEKEEKSQIKLKDRINKIVPFTSPIEFLIFKQAIDTGWDCPRAQILVKFRETKSITFSTQTLGRILRMPEAKYYDDDDLNTAYIYTNIEQEKMKIENEVYGGTIIKDIFSQRKSTYKPINILSYNKIRDTQGNIEAKYYSFLEQEFQEYFDISETKSLNYHDNFKKLELKGINIEPDVVTAILANGTVPSTKIDTIKASDIKFNNFFGIKSSLDDLQYKFNTIINNNLNGFPKARSIPIVRSAIFKVLKKFLNIEMKNGGAIYCQNLVIGNEMIFSQILDTSIKKYKEYKYEKDIDEKEKSQIYIENWNIEPKIYINIDNHIKYPSKLSLHQPLYLRKKNSEGKFDKLILEFINYLEKKKQYIEWFWKNGDGAKNANFGIRKPDGYAFRPDFIIKFKNDVIGIFDIKTTRQTEEDTRLKAEVLYNYIEDQRNKGKNLIGGIIIQDDKTFRVNMNENYKPFKENHKEWEFFDNIVD